MKIIYITSIGYSGSTLLDRLLETTPGAFSVGEIDGLKRACKSNQKVQNGKLMSDSSVWSAVCANITDYSEGNPEHHTLTEKFFGWMYPEMLHTKEGYDDEKLFGDVRKEGGRVRQEEVKNIIDSSKDPLRMISLHRYSNLDVNIIHLVRSPWGVVNSNIGHNEGWMMGCVRWLRTNIAIWWYTFWFVNQKDYMRVHYEDIARDPQKAVNNLDTKFSTGKLPENYLELINNRESYRFGGNVMMKDDIKEIKLDKSWKEGLSWYQKTVVGILCGPLYLFFKGFN